MSATDIGAGLGHAGVIFKLHNGSDAPVRLDGYPNLQLTGSNGKSLPTTVVRARNGAYLFRAAPAHEITLQPGHSASFDLQYGNAPVGAQASQGSAACPAASSARVTLPESGGDHVTVVPVNFAACGGQVLVSPVVPGTHWLQPQR